ncbi:FecR family protein [Mucilaginibacter sp. FT3.2]|uniref:FecR family protein n=1 Tax=Mucilaginibacter sp. FT3.2 TaxID=2723090 RepID=UPI00160C3F22|nr:ferric-dicitrate binding protein FerR (iron transport regulator) [Mucilaginibacter sp. FT3.2]
MTNYTNYEVEDFLHDDFFINWVLKGADEHNAFWNDWLLNNPDKKSVVENARRIVSSITVQPLDTTLSDTEVDELVGYIKNQLQHKPQNDNVVALKFNFSKYLKVAAILLAFILVGVLFVKTRQAGGPQLQQQLPGKPGSEYFSIINTSTDSKLIRMSDGSLAVLKPGSGIKYLKSFTKAREVFLDGEAFFEVHKNPAIPFQVHSSNMVVRVLGTSFTVKSQKDKQEFKVIVNTGKVLVYKAKKATDSSSDNQNSVTLIPNQQVTYQLKFKKETLPVPLILSKEIAQKEFTFDNTPFSVIVEKINRVYGVHIEYDKALLGNISLNASLSDRPLDEKVKLICKAVNASCEFIDGRIVISAQNK